MLVLTGTPLYAQEKGVVSVGTKEVTEVKQVSKTEPLLTKKQKIELDLQSTTTQIDLVIDRAQAALDLLSKNGKDTAIAQTALDKAKTSLAEAQEILLTLSVPESEKKETATKTVLSQKGAAQQFKDQIKKVQDSLKESRGFLIESITALKELLIQKETTEI